jgi:nucleotide-binding universal stress UspA family protein
MLSKNVPRRLHHMANHYQRILVAVDGSRQSEYALSKAIDVAKRNVGSQLNIVNVIENRAYEAFDRSVLERVQLQSEDLVKKYKEQAEAEGINHVKTVIDYGFPKTIITTKLAIQVEADVIICGATGLNAVERFLTGSVTEAIIRTAKCDVLVIRTPELQAAE